MIRKNRVLGCLLALVLSSCGGDSTPTTPAQLTGCVPTLLSPATGALLDNGCFDFSNPIVWDFAWSECPGADLYHLHVIGPNATIPVIDNLDLTATTYHSERTAWIDDARVHGWRWRVASRQRGVWNDWSAERTFEVEPVQTDCFPR